MATRILLALPLLLVLAAGALAQDARADRLKARETRDTMRSVAADLAVHMQTHGAYPEKLGALVGPGLREAMPRDAWGRDFVYAKTDVGGEQDFRLTSHGADGKPGGEGAAADIVFTSEGEKRELTPEQIAEREKTRAAATRHAHQAIARIEMAVIGKLVSDFRRNHKAWPATLAEVRPEAKTDQQRAVDRCFVDPWGNLYELKLLPHENFAIICRGADGKEGGTGDDADFVITEKEVAAHGAIDDEYGRRWRGGNYDWQTQNLAENVRAYRKQRGTLPKSLDDLTRAGDGANQPALRATIPRDSHGNEYVYVVYGPEEFFVVSLGADAEQGGKGDNADIVMPRPGFFERDYEEEAGGMKRMNPEVMAALVKVQAGAIAEKLNAHKTDNGAFPASLDDIKESFPAEQVPTDPWGNAFVYTLLKNEAGEVTGFRLKSLGSDGAEGGEGEAADLEFDEKGESTAKPAEATPAPEVPPQPLPPQPE